MKKFVGKNTPLKQTAIGHAIMQAVRPRAVTPPPPLWVQISHRNIAQTWFLFILSRSSEASAKCCCFTTFETPGLMQDQFLQLLADSINHNIQTLDRLNTFHSSRMISAITPGIKHTSRIIPRVAVTAEDVVAVAKVDIHFYKNVEMFNIKNMKNFQKLAKMIIPGTLIYT